MASIKDDGQSDRSRQQTRAILSAAFSNAAKDDLVTINPVKNSRQVDVNPPQIHPLTIEEVKLLLAETKDARMNARIRLAVIYGLRQSEALGLQWKDIDLEKALCSFGSRFKRSAKSSDM